MIRLRTASGNLAKSGFSLCGKTIRLSLSFVRIEFGIPENVTPQKFWPWREEDVARVFNACPTGTFSIDCWDVYKNGVLLRTEYNISAF